MNRRLMVLIVVVLGLVALTTSIVSAQGACQDPDNCPVGQQYGGRGNGPGPQAGTTGRGAGPGPQVGGMGNGAGPGPGPQTGGMGNGAGPGPAAQAGSMGNGMGPGPGTQAGAMGNGPVARGPQNGNQFGFGNGPANGLGNCLGDFSCLPPAVDGELTSEQIASMTDGWLDELNAYTVYAGIIEQFGDLRPFVNIQAGEVQHMAAWEFLFDRYGLMVPEAVPTVEVPQFATIAEACQFAYDVEVGNFGLYDNMQVLFEDYPDVTQVVTNLRDASEYNHAPALENCLAR